MNKELHQRDMVVYKKYFKILPDGLFYSYGNPTNTVNLKLSFESMGSHRVPAPFKSLSGLFVTFFTSIFIVSIIILGIFNNDRGVSTINGWIGIALILLDIFLAGLFIHYLLRANKKYFNITNLHGFNIEFISDKPSEFEVDEFVKDLMEARTAYLRENYFQVNKNLDYGQQINSLKFLFSEKIISKEEFDKSIAELNELFDVENPSKKIIVGFGRSTTGGDKDKS